jgi:hypothetical protein
MHNVIYLFWKTVVFGEFSPLHTCVMSTICAPVTVIQFKNQETVFRCTFSIPCLFYSSILLKILMCSILILLPHGTDVSGSSGSDGSSKTTDVWRHQWRYFFFCESPVTVLEELQKENGVQRKIAASDKRRFMWVCDGLTVFLVKKCPGRACPSKIYLDIWSKQKEYENLKRKRAKEATRPVLQCSFSLG